MSNLTAAIYRHSFRQELRVFLGGEDEDEDNLLHSEVARFDFSSLRDGASSLRAVLIESGWTDLALSLRALRPP